MIYKVVVEAKGEHPLVPKRYLARVIDAKGRGWTCKHYHQTHRGAATCATKQMRKVVDDIAVTAAAVEEKS